MSSRPTKRLALTLALAACAMGCALQLGRAPSSVASVALGPVVVGVPEPGLQEDLGRALARTLATRVAVGVGPLVSARVLSSRVSPVGPGGDTWEAQLSIRFSLETDPAVVVELQDTLLFQGTPDSWQTTSSARAAALGSLAERLCGRAVPLLLGPAKGSQP